MASVSRMFALALGGARHQAGDVDELHRGGHDLRRIVDFRKLIEALVGNGDDADVGLDGGERVVGGKTAFVGERGEQRGLAHVGQADDTDGKGHGVLLKRYVKPPGRRRS